MKIVNKRTVELTAEESAAKGIFENLLTDGNNIPDSVERVKELRPTLDPAFYRWLMGEDPMLRQSSRYFDQEVWEATVDAIETRFLRTEFEPGEFRVEHNTPMRQITIIRVSDNRAWTLLDVTGGYFTGGGNDNDPVLVHLPTGR